MRFRVLNKDPWFDYKEPCMATKGLDILKETVGARPKDEVAWWIKQIVANHSTIRSVHFRLVDIEPKSVVMQLIRATKGHPQPYVQSSRPDWTGIERSNDPYDPKMFIQDHTAESFIEMAKQRMCNRTEERTRKVMFELVEALLHSEDPFLKAVGFCCHPACWWYGACPELKSCTSNKDKLSERVLKLYRIWSIV